MARKRTDPAVEDRLDLLEHRYVELAQENVALWNRLRAVDSRLEELGFVATHHSADLKQLHDERRMTETLLFACHADDCVAERAPGSDWCLEHGPDADEQDDSSSCTHPDVQVIDGVSRCAVCGQPS
jgi:hypothetical protein